MAGYGKVAPDAHRGLRDLWIRDKYERKLFVEGAGTAGRSAEEREAAESAAIASADAQRNDTAMQDYIGTLSVVLVSASNVPKMDGVFGKCDPYCNLSLGAQSYTSSTQKNVRQDRLLESGGGVCDWPCDEIQ